MPRIIHRRRVFRAICLALASLLMLSSHAAETAGERPNVVFFVSDDLGWRDVGCYGSPNVKTPNLDRLAAEGMRFANADTASPVCGATRAQLYSGMYPGSYGSVGASSGLRPGRPYPGISNVFVDDVLVLQTHDETFHDGRFGLFVEKGTATFANVNANKITNETERDAVP